MVPLFSFATRQGNLCNDFGVNISSLFRTFYSEPWGDWGQEEKGMTEDEMPG